MGSELPNYLHWEVRLLGPYGAAAGQEVVGLSVELAGLHLGEALAAEPTPFLGCASVLVLAQTPTFKAHGAWYQGPGWVALWGLQHPEEKRSDVRI